MVTCQTYSRYKYIRIDIYIYIWLLFAQYNTHIRDAGSLTLGEGKHFPFFACSASQTHL